MVMTMTLTESGCQYHEDEPHQNQLQAHSSWTFLNMQSPLDIHLSRQFQCLLFTIVQFKQMYKNVSQKQA